MEDLTAYAIPGPSKEMFVGTGNASTACAIVEAEIKASNKKASS
jgi:hypothetical protein